MHKQKRTRVKIGDPAVPYKPQVEVIVGGFGEFHKHFKVGLAIAHTSRHIIVRLRDVDGTYEERYSAHTGKRVADLTAPSGLRINLEDLVRVGAYVPKAVTDKTQAGTQRLARIHHEEVPFTSASEDGDVMVVEVYEDSISKKRYLKCYRSGPRKEDDLKKMRRIQERGCAIPFAVLKRVLFQFDLDTE